MESRFLKCVPYTSDQLLPCFITIAIIVNSGTFHSPVCMLFKYCQHHHLFLRTVDNLADSSVMLHFQNGYGCCPQVSEDKPESIIFSESTGQKIARCCLSYDLMLCPWKSRVKWIWITCCAGWLLMLRIKCTSLSTPARGIFSDVQHFGK